LMMKLY